MRGVEQSRFHHRDVYGHTLEVLEQTIALTTADGWEMLSQVALWAWSTAHLCLRCSASRSRTGLTRGEALRWGALLHDAAKPATRSVRVLDRRVTFIGHDMRGAELDP